MLEKRGKANGLLVASAYPGDIKDFEIRGVNALEKPLKIVDVVESVTDIVEHKFLHSRNVPLLITF
jgi:hypothetical protein